MTIFILIVELSNDTQENRNKLGLLLLNNYFQKHLSSGTNNLGLPVGVFAYPSKGTLDSVFKIATDLINTIDPNAKKMMIITVNGGIVGENLITTQAGIFDPFKDIFKDFQK